MSSSSSCASHPSDSHSAGSCQEEYEDIVWTKEVAAPAVELELQGGEFEASAEMKVEKVRNAGLDFFFFDECEFKINPPRRPVDLAHWLHARVLRWRFVRWRY